MRKQPCADLHTDLRHIQHIRTPQPAWHANPVALLERRLLTLPLAPLFPAAQHPSERDAQFLMPIYRALVPLELGGGFVIRNVYNRQNSQQFYLFGANDHKRFFLSCKARFHATPLAQMLIQYLQESQSCAS